MANINSTMSIIKCECLNSPMERQKLSDWTKSKIQLYAVNKRHTLHSRLKVKRWGKRIYYGKGNHKRAGVIIQILDKTDFNTNTTGDKKKIFHNDSNKEPKNNKAISNITKKKNRKFNNYTWRF